MRDKIASLTVDGVQYKYSIRVRDENIRITVYRLEEKVPLFTVNVRYIEAWGFDVYRPRMIEILIRYDQRRDRMLSDNRLKLCEHPELFQELLDCFFAGDSRQEREKFVKQCRG